MTNDHQRRAERFREFMKAFNPTAPPDEPIRLGLVSTELHNRLFERIAARAEIEPSSQQLVTGGIGSGKTTEILLARDQLRGHGVQVIYVEVSRYIDLAKAAAGSLIAMLGVELIPLAEGTIENRKAAKAMEVYAIGEWVDRECEPDFHEPVVFVPGKLRPRVSWSTQQIENMGEVLGQLLMAVRVAGDVVVIFDGLDRLPNGGRFWELVSTDLNVLRELSIPVVLVGPWSLLFEQDAQLDDRFDRVHRLNAETYEKRLEKLSEILARRDSGGLIPPEQKRQLANGAGAIIRDLITLARDAAEEAFAAGADSIEENHVEIAIHNLGDSYLRGLSSSQIGILKSWTETKSFDPSNPEIVTLLTSRRLIERKAPKYRIHPALATVLKETR